MTPRKALSDFRKDDSAIHLPQQRPLMQWQADRWVIGVDQSIANTGWCIVSTDSKGIPSVEKTGMIKTESMVAKGGFADTYARLEVIEDAYEMLLETYRMPVIHEMPAVFGKRTDSPLLTSVVLRSVARRLDIPIDMVSANRVKKAVAGKPNASKAEVKAAVKSHAPTVVNCKPANEHTFDAVALCLTHLRTS